jgi:putative endonuclease
MKLHHYYVYIITNNYNTVLYTGITNNMVRRSYEHKQGSIPGFCSKYNVHKLVYFEMFSHVNDAINREKQIKGYRREKKNNLINNFNPEWKELFQDGQIVIPGLPQS